MPVVRNPQFYFREGFCWSDINTHYLKCRLKGRSVNDVKSMSLYGITEKVPEFFIISLINSKFMSGYVDDFVNNTQTFQINDARQLPVIIPSKQQLKSFKELFDQAYSTKKKQFQNKITSAEAEKELFNIQQKLDKMVYELYAI